MTAYPCAGFLPYFLLLRRGFFILNSLGNSLKNAEKCGIINNVYLAVGSEESK